MELCKYCKDIDFYAAFPQPGNYEGKGYKHHPDLASMIQASTGSSGCELCSFFLKCAEEWPQDRFDEVREGGQLYLCGRVGGEMFIASKVMRPRTLSAIEHERSPHSANLYLCQFACFAPHNSSRSSPRKAEVMSADSSSDACFANVTSWLTECSANHPKCREPCEPVLPTRVLDLGSSDDQSVCLVTTNHLRGRWVALSHCWGKSVPLQLRQEYLTEMEKGIPNKSLPPTFQDAVYITRRLGFRYLWIDSLCIIQDSLEDWNHESGRMAYVYSNSTLTISAEAARNSSFGIFRSANARRPKHTLKLKCQLNDYDLDHVWFGTKPDRDREPFHLHERAWVLQETILPPRVLSYTSQQIIFNCRTTHRTEQTIIRVDEDSLFHLDRAFEAKQILFSASSPKGGPIMATEIVNEGCLNLRDPLISDQKGAPKPSAGPGFETRIEEVLGEWYRIVEAYSSRQLTFEKDQLPAIAGIAKVVGHLTGYSYRAGLWDEDLVYGFAWQPIRGMLRGAQRSNHFVAPSWTWASMRSQEIAPQTVALIFPPYFRAADDTKVLEVHLDYLSDDPYLGVSSGFLKISGPCRLWQLGDRSESGFDNFEHGSNDRGTLLLLLIGTESLPSMDEYELTQYALILEESDLRGIYKRVGLWTTNKETETLDHWTVQILTII